MNGGRARFARWIESPGLGSAVLTLMTVPVLAGLGKSTTNIFTPAQIRRYGGDMPYIKLFETYPANGRPEERGRGFPAGHASGGSALLGLVALRRTRAWRWGAIALGLGAGWAMDGYQMLKGVRYLSHTVATMLLAWGGGAVLDAGVETGAGIDLLFGGTSSCAAGIAAVRRPRGSSALQDR